MIHLYTDKYDEIELSPSFDISLNYTLLDLDNPSSMSTPYTTTVNIPRTRNNELVLGNPQLDSFDRVYLEPISILLYEDSSFIMNGNLIIKSITNDVFLCNLLFKDWYWLNTMKNITWEELQRYNTTLDTRIIPESGIQITKENIINSWSIGSLLSWYPVDSPDYYYGNVLSFAPTNAGYSDNISSDTFVWLDSNNEPLFGTFWDAQSLSDATKSLLNSYQKDFTPRQVLQYRSYDLQPFMKMRTFLSYFKYIAEYYNPETEVRLDSTLSNGFTTIIQDIAYTLKKPKSNSNTTQKTPTTKYPTTVMDIALNKGTNDSWYSTGGTIDYFLNPAKSNSAAISLDVDFLSGYVEAESKQRVMRYDGFILSSEVKWRLHVVVKQGTTVVSDTNTDLGIPKTYDFDTETNLPSYAKNVQINSIPRDQESNSQHYDIFITNLVPDVEYSVSIGLNLVLPSDTSTSNVFASNFIYFNADKYVFNLSISGHDIQYSNTGSIRSYEYIKWEDLVPDGDTLFSIFIKFLKAYGLRLKHEYLAIPNGNFTQRITITSQEPSVTSRNPSDISDMIDLQTEYTPSIATLYSKLVFNTENEVKYKNFSDYGYGTAVLNITDNNTRDITITSLNTSKNIFSDPPSFVVQSQEKFYDTMQLHYMITEPDPAAASRSSECMPLAQKEMKPQDISGQFCLWQYGNNFPCVRTGIFDTETSERYYNGVWITDDSYYEIVDAKYCMQMPWRANSGANATFVTKYPLLGEFTKLPMNIIIRNLYGNPSEEYFNKDDSYYYGTYTLFDLCFKRIASQIYTNINKICKFKIYADYKTVMNLLEDKIVIIYGQKYYITKLEDYSFNNSIGKLECILMTS